MLRALMKGDNNAEDLAEMSKGTLRRKIPQLRRALEGQVTTHHRLLLTGHWSRMEFLERESANLETQIAERMKPTSEEMALTAEHSGRRTSAVIAVRGSHPAQDGYPEWVGRPPAA
jgi:hypothetical protein